MAVVANRYKEYKDTLIDAYGVYVADQTVDIKVDDDPFFIMDTVRESILNDIAKAASCGNPSGAYDIEFLQLEDGRMAMKLTGDVQMTGMIKTSPDAEATQENVIYPMQAYIIIEKGTPIAVWCTYDSFDKTAADTAFTKLLEAANTLWNTKPTEQEQEQSTALLPTAPDAEATIPGEGDTESMEPATPIEPEAPAKPATPEVPVEQEGQAKDEGETPSPLAAPTNEPPTSPQIAVTE